jgi:hypothetical protein
MSASATSRAASAAGHTSAVERRSRRAAPRGTGPDRTRTSAPATTPAASTSGSDADQGTRTKPSTVRASPDVAHPTSGARSQKWGSIPRGSSRRVGA